MCFGKLSTDQGENKTCLPLTSLPKGKSLIFMLYDKFFTPFTSEDVEDEEDEDDEDEDEEEGPKKEIPEEEGEDWEDIE